MMVALGCLYTSARIHCSHFEEEYSKLVQFLGFPQLVLRGSHTLAPAFEICLWTTVLNFNFSHRWKNHTQTSSLSSCFVLYCGDQTLECFVICVREVAPGTRFCQALLSKGCLPHLPDPKSLLRGACSPYISPSPTSPEHLHVPQGTGLHVAVAVRSCLLLGIFQRRPIY